MTFFFRLIWLPYICTSCVQWADLREPTLSPPETWKDNQENQKEKMYFVDNSAADSDLRPARFFSQPKKVGNCASAPFPCDFTGYERGLILQRYLWVHQSVIEALFFLSGPNTHSAQKHFISILIWPISWQINCTRSHKFQVPTKRIEQKPLLHVCVYISVYIGALFCIYFCFFYDQYCVMCCSCISIGQALVLQTPKFYIFAVQVTHYSQSYQCI